MCIIRFNFRVPIGQIVLRSGATEPCRLWPSTRLMTFMSATDNKGDRLNNQPAHRADLGLTWRPTSALHLWSRARYKGHTRFFGRGGPADGDSPSYTLVDGGIKYDATEHVSVYGGIYNILDKRLRNDVYGRVVDGRRFNLGTKVRF